MRYAQISKGRRLHLVYEPGEGESADRLIPAGRLSAPLCRTPAFSGRYRMTINVPLANACRNCRRIYSSRQSWRDEGDEGLQIPI